MHKVLLVDDEMFVRKGLCSLIEWEEHGFSVAGEAENGEEALREIVRLKPDLVISDIRMPLMDGLELIRRTVELPDADPAFIIISGYNDFAYAKQAIQFGVHDYILKPIDDAELSATLRKLAGTLSRKKLMSHTQDRQLTSSIMDTLIHGAADEEYASVATAALGVEPDSMFCYAVIEVYDEEIGMKEVAEAAKSVEGEIDGAALTSPGGAQQFPVFEQQDGRCGLLLAWKPGEEQEPDRRLGAIAADLSRTLNAPAVLFAGKIVSGIPEIKQSYITANETVKHKYAEDYRPVLRYDQISGKPLHGELLSDSFYDRFMEQLEENDVPGCMKTIGAMFDSFRQDRFDPGAVWSAINRSAIAIMRVIQEMEGNAQQLPSFRHMKNWEHRRTGPKQLQELFERFVTEASEYINQLRQDQSKGGIEKIRKYIETHYDENISLKTIAAHFYMNPVYLGQLFRKSYGVYFNDFLLSIRMTEAKKLLRLTDLRMYEVASKVGFQNADYFVAQFVKQEGMTPKEYRNKLIEKP
ncbi:response regulator [Paenibacillus soyae]|uniref:Response regulator n=1 Tax=Paenibacillus soyae TaxID=2969249 RepID=A0A9X2MNG9_9BACL|nr:response regulator [Paenibacillus soyae]MCR2803324.1 response regulator [Paenibacillus soyae]